VSLVTKNFATLVLMVFGQSDLLLHKIYGSQITGPN